jgi:hypothetical protein
MAGWALDRLKYMEDGGGGPGFPLSILSCECENNYKTETFLGYVHNNMAPNSCPYKKSYKNSELDFPNPFSRRCIYCTCRFTIYIYLYMFLVHILEDNKNC